MQANIVQILCIKRSLSLISIWTFKGAHSSTDLSSRSLAPPLNETNRYLLNDESHVPIKLFGTARRTSKDHTLLFYCNFLWVLKSPCAAGSFWATLHGNVEVLKSWRILCTTRSRNVEAANKIVFSAHIILVVYVNIVTILRKKCHGTSSKRSLSRTNIRFLTSLFDKIVENERVSHERSGKQPQHHEKWFLFKKR